MSPIACIFFQVSHNFMKHCSCSVFLSLIFSFPLSFLSFSPFLSAHARCFHGIFSPSGGGGNFPIYKPLVERCAGVYGVGNILKTSVADPDPGLGAFLPLDPGSGIGFFRIQSDHWIRIRNLNTDPDPGGQKWHLKKKIMFWSVGWPLLWAGGFFCDLDILYGGLGIGKLQFLIDNWENLWFRTCRTRRGVARVTVGWGWRAPPRFSLLQGWH